jgi:hypothetical protein
MHKPSTCQVPVDKAHDRANRVERKPKHEIFRTITPIDRHNFSNLDTQVIHEPIANPDDRVEELSIRPCLALKDQEGMVWSIAQGLLLPDMVCQDSLLHHTVSDEIDHILRGCKTTASMLEVVHNVEFRVEVGGKRCCSSCSRSYHWSLESAYASLVCIEDLSLTYGPFLKPS